MTSKQIAPRDSQRNAYMSTAGEFDRFYELFCEAFDPELARCSFAARWLWANLLDVMCEAKPLGHLLIDGDAATPMQIAALLGDGENDIPHLLAELVAKGVFGVNAAGITYSRQLVSGRPRAPRYGSNVA